MPGCRRSDRIHVHASEPHRAPQIETLLAAEAAPRRRTVRPCGSNVSTSAKHVFYEQTTERAPRVAPRPSPETLARGARRAGTGPVRRGHKRAARVTEPAACRPAGLPHGVAGSPLLPMPERPARACPGQAPAMAPTAAHWPQTAPPKVSPAGRGIPGPWGARRPCSVIGDLAGTAATRPPPPPPGPPRQRCPRWRQIGRLLRRSVSTLPPRCRSSYPGGLVLRVNGVSPRVLLQ